MRRTEAKASGPLVALSQIGAPHWGGRDARALMRSGYARNPVVYRCVRMIAEAAASVPLKVTGDERAVRLLARPNGEETGTDLLERAYASLQVAGNAYVEGVGVPGEGPDSLYLLPSERVRAVRDARGWVSGHAVRVKDGERVILREADGWCPVMHLKLHNPADEGAGQSPLMAAACAVELHNASADWAKALIDNAARPSGALVYGRDGARMTDEQFDRLKRELTEAHTGASNAGRPLLLEGGLDWKPMSLTPAEMDFQEARHGAMREIALAFGVPPMLLGIPGDNTFANYREANLAFWRLSVLPLVEKTARALEEWLGDRFEGVAVRADLDRVSALSPEREGLWARVGAADFLTRAEKRAFLGIAETEAGE
jgi:HK97 family phage portal protein